MSHVIAFYNLIEDEYSKVADLNAHEWSRSFVEAVFHAYSLSDPRRSPRMLVILSNVLASLPIETRELLMDDMNMGREVSEAVVSPDPWPVQFKLRQFVEVEGVDLEEFRNRTMAQINDDAERVAMQLLRPGFRFTLTVMQKQMEMQDYFSSNMDESRSYPHLEASVGVLHADLHEAATATLQTQMMWSVLNAQIERAALIGLRDATTATTFSEVSEAATTAKAGMIEAVQAALVGPSEEPDSPGSQDQSEPVEKEASDEGEVPPA